MALPILDGNQSATTLSTILSSGQHIPAHTVVSLGTQAITDMRSAVSGSVVSISNFPATQPVSIASVTIGNTVTIAGTVTANPTGTQTIAGTVSMASQVYGETTNIYAIRSAVAFIDGGDLLDVTDTNPLPISGTVAIGSALPAGTNRIGVVTIGAGTVTIGAGTAQIGSVTASNLTSALAVYGGGNSDISVNIKSVGGQSFGQGQTWVPVAIAEGSLPAGTNRIGVVTIGAGTVTIGAGTAQIGSVTASISGTVPISISSVTVGNSVTIGSLPAISGTVIANSSSGSLTTRFGSVVTANTAFATSAVTNANRKYLLIQNITTASNVITVGVGFAPTTTQGIQLSAGAGLTFEGNYIPTGAVNLLSSVTASCFTILEA